MGLIGPNGGGKTTLLQVILGVVRPDRGTVRVFGREVSKPDSLRGDIGYVAQSKRFERDFPARAKDVVLMGTFPEVGLFRFPGAEHKKRALAALEQVGMAGRADRPIGRLSGGSSSGCSSPRPWSPAPASSSWTSPRWGSIARGKRRSSISSSWG